MNPSCFTTEEKKVKLSFFVSVACAAVAVPALAADVTYRNDIKPFIKAQCAECHAGDAPTLAEFKLNEKKYTEDKLGPRTDTYENLLQIVVFPDHGAFMRRLDDGTNTPDKKPGNMYKHLGETDAERAKNLLMIKAWVGEGAWNLNRWGKKGDVPGITKEQLDKFQIKY